MARLFNQKIKLLKLLELLTEHTDEQHPMSTNQIIYALEEMGIKVERKTLYEDIKLLVENGYEIMCIRDRANKYYVEDRKFDVAELRVLMDSVQSAKLITPKKTEEFAVKIANLAGTNRGEVLKRNIVWLDTVKHSNEAVYYNIDTLNTAIVQGKKASFQYFDFDISGKKVYRKETEKYVVSPIALIFNADNYYLVEYNEKHSALVNYRIDKMDNVRVLDDLISEKAQNQKSKIPSYKAELFDMFNGEKRVATFEADESLVDVILDKFGQKVRFEKKDNKIIFKVNVHIAPTFYSWITIFGKKIKLLGDQKLVDGYKKFLTDAMESV
ncbi:MAG: WYL domain-containing protein [Clostridia bacterium]|nr:WYL domain-containing protein [Clostridia bacterium]